MRSELRIALLGGLRITSRGQVVAVESQRLQALLAYLILHADTPQPRQHLAFLFWPDSTEDQARTNLRQLLHQLRRSVPHVEHVVATTRRTLHWRAGEAKSDVAELEVAWHAADSALERDDSTQAIGALRHAAELYAGDLLPSCYDEWIEPVRDRLRRRHESALLRLIDLLESRREYREAAACTARMLELDPFREETYRTSIRLHGLAGEPALAAAAFRRCTEALAREFGIEPSPQTRELTERIVRAGDGLASGELAAVAGASSATSRTTTRGPAAVKFVGRHAEWQQLRRAWDAAAAGAPRVVVVAGEAGIGKSRLVEELAATLAREGILAATARCFAAEGLLPFGPIAQWLRSEPLRRSAVRLDDPWARELTRLLPELRPEASRVTSEPGTEPARRLRLFEALARGVLASSQPTLLVLDDIQWCDTDTLEWLHYLLRFDRATPLLLLTTLRLGELEPDSRVASWILQLQTSQQLSQLSIGPLDEDETRALGCAVAEREIEDMEALELFRETEGNPLFIVESVRARHTRSRDPIEARGGLTVESHGAGANEIPAPVQAVIRHRLAQLSREARSLVAYAATIGREVPLAVLRHAARDEVEVVHALDELCQRVLLRERPGHTYDFSHDRIREVAYLDLSSARRALLHYQIARALERLYPDDDDVAGEIARHLERADRPEEAIPYYRSAANRALSLFANEEAESDLRRALNLLERLPATRQRLQLELELNTALGVPLVAQYHYSDPRVWRTYERARGLAAQLGQPASPPVLRALALANLMRSRLPDVLELGRALLDSARSTRDPILQVEAHYVLGVAFFWRGRVPAARRHLQRALAHYDPALAREHLRLYAQDPAAICGVRLALAEWHAGLGDAAHARCVAALAQAEALRHPLTLAYTRYFGCFVLIECGDLVRARAETAALLRESTEHGLANWPTTGAIFEGWLRVEAGDPAGIDIMRAAAAAYTADGFSLGFPYHQSLLARGLRRLGRHEEALDAVSEGLTFSERTGERFWDAELLRLGGELLGRLGAPPGAVESRYREALGLAQRQGAHALADRAVAALGRVGGGAEITASVRS